MTDLGDIVDHEEAVIFSEIAEERVRQLSLWGDQHRISHTQTHTGGTDRDRYASLADEYKHRNAVANEPGWDYVLLEEVYEALAEEDPARIAEELTQVAAVCVAWRSDMERDS